MNNVTNSNISSKLFTSKIHKYENLPEPKNATEEEQEAFYSKSYDFSVPYNIDDFGKSTVLLKMIAKNYPSANAKYEAYNNPNLHSEEQDEFEIPDGGF
ncbi:unnamed protein product [Rhizophagus irregularis]|uniref:Uncharacterized protein n=1 Tax=Rhizophagus irregularis TaxID=588596 RepID=A0A916E4S7_9GLOM|nr:unnamed protein product [Rhizophagus irregularis]